MHTDHQYKHPYSFRSCAFACPSSSSSSFVRLEDLLLGPSNIQCTVQWVTAHGDEMGTDGITTI